MNYDLVYIENYILLARTIIWLHCKDYIRVVKGLMRDSANYRLQKEYRTIMEFFESREFEAYTLGADYQVYIRELNKVVNEGKKFTDRPFVAKRRETKHE